MLCDKCKKKEESHKLSRVIDGKWVERKLCCGCYIEEGNSPADWHEDCHVAYDAFLVKKYGHIPY
jgi:protein-arginine kinase activator protein McsA